MRPLAISLGGVWINEFAAKLFELCIIVNKCSDNVILISFLDVETYNRGGSLFGVVWERWLDGTIHIELRLFWFSLKKTWGEKNGMD